MTVTITSSLKIGLIDAQNAVVTPSQVIPYLTTENIHDPIDPNSTLDEILETHIYTYTNKAALESAMVSPTINTIYIRSYAVAGDGGQALYKRTVSEPTHPGKIQSDNGVWWEIVEPVLWAEMFGAVGDGSVTTPSAGTNNTTALQNWLTAGSVLGREMRIGKGVFSTDALTYPYEATTKFNLRGSGPANSIIRKRSSDGGNLLTIGNTTTQQFMEGGVLSDVAFYGVSGNTPEVLAMHSPNQWNLTNVHTYEGIIGNVQYNAIGNVYDRVLSKTNQKGIVFTRKVYGDATTSQPNLNVITGSWFAANTVRGLEFDWGKILLIQSTNFGNNGTISDNNTGGLWVGPNLAVDNGAFERGVECIGCWFEGNKGYVAHLAGKSNHFLGCKFIANNDAVRDLYASGGTYTLIDPVIIPDKAGGNIEDAAGVSEGNIIIGGSIRNATALNLSKTQLHGVTRGSSLNSTDVLSFSDRPGVEIVSTDAGKTLTSLSSPRHLLHTGTLTQARAITLSSANVYPGARFKITRTGSGAFNLNINTESIGIWALLPNEWCEVLYDGTDWKLTQFGALTRP